MVETAFPPANSGEIRWKTLAGPTVWWKLLFHRQTLVEIRWKTLAGPTVWWKLLFHRQIELWWKFGGKLWPVLPCGGNCFSTSKLNSGGNSVENFGRSYRVVETAFHQQIELWWKFGGKLFQPNLTLSKHLYSGSKYLLLLFFFFKHECRSKLTS